MGMNEFAQPASRALTWLMNGPVRDYSWIGNYEDIPTGRTDRQSNNVNNFDAVWMARYLLDHLQDHPEYLTHARNIERWIEEGFAFWTPEPPIEFMRFIGPVVMEQAEHYYPIDFHAANLARLEWQLYDVTHDETYRAKAVSLLNGLTHHFDDQGRPLTYAPDPDVGYGLIDNIWFGCAAAAWTALTEGTLRLGALGQPAQSNPDS